MTCLQIGGCQLKDKLRSWVNHSASLIQLISHASVVCWHQLLLLQEGDDTKNSRF